MCLCERRRERDMQWKTEGLTALFSTPQLVTTQCTHSPLRMLQISRTFCPSILMLSSSPAYESWTSGTEFLNIVITFHVKSYYWCILMVEWLLCFTIQPVISKSRWLVVFSMLKKKHSGHHYFHCLIFAARMWPITLELTAIHRLQISTLNVFKAKLFKKVNKLLQ